MSGEESSSNRYQGPSEFQSRPELRPPMANRDTGRVGLLEPGASLSSLAPELWLTDVSSPVCQENMRLTAGKQCE